MEIKKFDEILNKYFKGNIKLSFVSDVSLIIITRKDDKVYKFNRRNPSLRANNKTFMLLNDDDDDKSYLDSIMHKYFIEEFSFKGIVDLKYCQKSITARTENGKLYCWDSNFMGEFRRASNSISSPGAPKVFYEVYKPQSNHHLRDKNIIDICCGDEHILALSSDGDVYAWGGNNFGEIGNCNNEYQYTPYKFEEFNCYEIIAISCGRSHSMVLTNCGRVFTWGLNDYGQLGIESLESSNKPVPIKSDVHFDKISCSDSHNLLLARNGDIYVFGANDFGQLGTGNRIELTNPHKLTFDTRMGVSKFTDIASHPQFSISVAISEDGFCYIWGKCGIEEDSEDILTPRKTSFKTFNDVSIHYFDMTYEPTHGRIIQFRDHLILENGFFKFYFLTDEMQELGSGSFGSVYKVEKRKCATDEMKLKRDFFAVKKIKFESDNQNEFIKELSTSRSIFNLLNDNLVKYYGSWLENESIQDENKQFQIFNENLTLYIQMEICDRDLLTMINEIKIDEHLCDSSSGILTCLGYYLSVEIFLQIVKGVDYLHRHKIIHRDLKPKNILLKIEEDSYYFVKVCDYGIVAAEEYDDNTINETKNVGKDSLEKLHTTDKGDLDYAAPEVLEGDGMYNTKADIYSMGRILLDLFNIEKDSYKEDFNNYRNDVKQKMPKYHYLMHLWDKMLEQTPSERPDCEQILYRRHEMTLNIKESDKNEELVKFFKSHENEISYTSKILNIRTIFGNRSLPDMYIEKNFPYDSSYGIREGIREVFNSVEMAKNLISLDLINDSLLELKASISGPPDTPYYGGIFHIEIKVQDKYPRGEFPNQIRFLTNIWHPNISSVTRVYRSNDQEHYVENQFHRSIKEVLSKLIKDLTVAELGYLEDKVVAEQYEENPELFRQTALCWTYLYAIDRAEQESAWPILDFQRKTKSLMEKMSIDEHKAMSVLSYNNWDFEKATLALL